MKFNLIKFSLATLTILFSNIYCSVPDKTESEGTISSASPIGIVAKEFDNLNAIQQKVMDAIDRGEFEPNKSSLQIEFKKALEKVEKAKKALKGEFFEAVSSALNDMIDYYNQHFVYTKCSNCKKSFETFKCTGCKYINYCSKKCQKADWKKNHKENCKEFNKLRIRLEDAEKTRENAEKILELANTKEAILNAFKDSEQQRLDKLPKLDKTESDKHSKVIEENIEFVHRIMKPKIADLRFACEQLFYDVNPDVLIQKFKKALNDALTELSKLEKALANDLQPEIVDLLKSYKKEIEALSNPPELISSSTVISISSLEPKASPTIISSASPKEEKTESKEVETKDKQIDSPELINALLKGNTEEAIKLIKSNKINLDYQDDLKFTALMIASRAGYYGISELLLDHGANINLQNKDGNTALIITTDSWHNADLQSAQYEMVELLIKYDANLNAQNNQGKTALIHAVENKQYQIAKLLKNGTNINLQSKNGDTALIHATLNQNIEMVDLLTQECTNINHQNKFGWTALMYASYLGNYEIVKLLIERDADTNIINIKGHTALMILNTNKNKIESYEKIRKFFEFAEAIKKLSPSLRK